MYKKTAKQFGIYPFTIKRLILIYKLYSLDGLMQRPSKDSPTLELKAQEMETLPMF